MSLFFPSNLGSLVLFFAITASANDELAISESDYLSDIPVVVSATRLPQHIASQLFSHKFSPGWQFSTAAYYMSEVVWFNGDFIDDYLRTDLKLAKELQLKGDLTLTTAVIAQNAFNEQYFEFQNSNQFERRLFFKASLNY